MRNQKTTKKGFLATGIGVLTIGVTMATNGAYVEGGLLVAVGVGLVVGYDYLDDRVKGTPSLPDGVTEASITAAVELAAQQINSLRDSEDSAADTAAVDNEDNL